MDIESDEIQLKELLVHLEQEHKHLQASIEHLSNDIVKRELEVRKLLADRQLESTRATITRVVTDADADTKFIKNRVTESQPIDLVKACPVQPTIDEEFSSEYSRKVSQLLDKIIKTSEEVSSLVKL